MPNVENENVLENQAAAESEKSPRYRVAQSPDGGWDLIAFTVLEDGQENLQSDHHFTTIEELKKHLAEKNINYQDVERPSEVIGNIAA